jgi:tetratricopeptide (TPR) repeat protein
VIDQIRGWLPKATAVVLLLAACGAWAERAPDFEGAFRELQLGYVALDEKDFGAAYRHYRRAEEIARGDEQRFNALFGLGTAAFELELFVEARSAFERAHEMRPDEPETTYMLGVTCRRQGDLETAIRYLAEAFARDEDLTGALVELGIAYGLLERHADAERVCREVVKREPDNVEARLGLAVALFHLDENEAAVGEFRQVLDHNPGNVRAHYGLGLALLYSGDRSGALDELNYLNEHAPALADDLYSWLYPNR